MKKYIQADFDALVRAYGGYLYLPSGDWTGVDFGGADKLIFANFSVLGNNCVLGSHCKLGKGCKLGNRCKLGEYCKLERGCVLGNICKLGECCKLDNGCKLGSWCKLGNGCILDSECKLGNSCVLGNHCKLGCCCELSNNCELGDYCWLGDGCEFGSRCVLRSQCVLENGAVENAVFFKVSNIGSRNDNAYAYCNTATGEIFVRAGCWFSDINDFEARVHEVHAGTGYEWDYIAFCDFARMRFKKYQSKRP